MREVAEQLDASQSQLVEQYYPLARAIACRIHQRLPSGVNLDDLVGAAIGGLVDAAERFDSTRAVSFRTFAKHRIQGAVMDSLRAADWVPRAVRRRADQIEGARTALRNQLGRAPTADELANRLGVTTARLDELQQTSDIRTVLSLDAAVGGDNATPLAEAVADDTDPHRDLQLDELRQAAAEAIGTLPERERAAIVLYYFRGLSLKEVGMVLDVTESRACQICTQAIKRLRIRLRAHL